MCQGTDAQFRLKAYLIAPIGFKQNPSPGGDNYPDTEGYSPDFHVLQVPETFRGIRVLSPRFLADAHARNLKVYVWTVNAPAQLQQLQEWGVDGILTDFPDRLRTLLEG